MVQIRVNKPKPAIFNLKAGDSISSEDVIKATNLIIIDENKQNITQQAVIGKGLFDGGFVPDENLDSIPIPVTFDGTLVSKIFLSVKIEDESYNNNDDINDRISKAIEEKNQTPIAIAEEDFSEKENTFEFSIEMSDENTAIIIALAPVGRFTLPDLVFDLKGRKFESLIINPLTKTGVPGNAANMLTLGNTSINNNILYWTQTQKRVFAFGKKVIGVQYTVTLEEDDESNIPIEKEAPINEDVVNTEPVIDIPVDEEPKIPSLKTEKEEPFGIELPSDDDFGIELPLTDEPVPEKKNDSLDLDIEHNQESIGFKTLYTADEFLERKEMLKESSINLDEELNELGALEGKNQASNSKLGGLFSKSKGEKTNKKGKVPKVKKEKKIKAPKQPKQAKVAKLEQEGNVTKKGKALLIYLSVILVFLGGIGGGTLFYRSKGLQEIKPIIDKVEQKQESAEKLIASDKLTASDIETLSKLLNTSASELDKVQTKNFFALEERNRVSEKNNQLVDKALEKTK